MRPDPDAELINLWRTGSEAERRSAFRELYRNYHSKVFKTAWAVTGDESAAADVTQETFLQVYRKFDAFESRSTFSSWLYRIAVNFANEWRRRERRAPARLAGSDEDGGAGDLGLEDERLQDHDARLIEDERHSTVHQVLQQLSPKLRNVAVLRHIEGCSYEEVASILGCSVGTVKSRLNRAHEALSRLLTTTLGGR